MLIEKFQAVFYLRLSVDILLLLILRQRVAEQLGCDIDNRDDFFVIHALRTDHRQRTNNLTIRSVRRTNYAALV